MKNNKSLNIFLSLLIITSLLCVGVSKLQTADAAPPSPTDESLVPHYYGPYPNWANSPQVLADAIVTIGLGTPTPGFYGNPLAGRAYATDTATPPGTLGNVFVVIPSAVLPAGTLNSFQTWNQATPGGSPTPSAGGLFHAYVLRPTGTANQYNVVYDSGELTVPALTDPAVSEQATFPVAPGVAVQAGDVIGFYGEGIPVDLGVTTNQDTFSFPATADPTLLTTQAPAQGAIISLGADPGFPIYATQDRTYSFAATVTPTVVDPGTGATATATVNPNTGGISAITVTDPGAGYILPPSVTITAAGITPTALASATAQISLGVVNNIAVNETGFGFTTPSVTLTGGNPTPGFEAVAVASGSVDFLELTGGGSGYLIEPVVVFSLPDLPGGVQATGTATMDANGIVTEVALVNPGSGYTAAPTVTILDVDAPVTTPGVAATAVATIGIGQIDITSGGQGYDSAPTVDITDAGGTSSVPATATASVAVKGAVTSITVTNAGAGYLTPGLKKFVDTLPGLGPDAMNNLDQYIPIGVPDQTTYPGTDYYEIAVVQYRMQFHSDLPATLLRGYVQLSTSVVPGNQVPLNNANIDPGATATPIEGYTGVDNPHYLGPTIVATKDRPVRILFRNLLPTGADGNLFLPVDTSLMGSGPGPDMMELDANGVPMEMAVDQGSVLDGVRNPVCGELPKQYECFSENRATLHLHGGITPWISDGTPHQWTTPAGENTAYPEGVSVSNVPDMPDPGPGAITFFYTNQQSARLLFYHDHAWGITRLNVYAGEAAGYLITDDTEQELIGTGGALEGLGLGTPLIIQDKTFLPSPAKVAEQDPTWQYNRWGGEGSLWAPHVYMPAQNPGDPSGMSSFGRWMYGPFFWPPANAEYPPIANPYYDPACDPDVEPFCEPALIPATPNVSVGMEAFNDTPIVNGTAYPTTNVDPKAYRFRVLNAANDRFWNLSWYVADPRTGTLSEVALNPAEVAAAQTDPVIFPTPDTTWSPAGPSWIQIGTEGGFLPAPVVVPAQPTTWITDPTRFDVGLVDLHSLLLAPAERADVIVDFSQYRGKTLILYNDAPAAFPARVPGYDYYTGGPDLSPSGAPTTLPGYGPNTRTVMQVKVSNAAPAVAFDRPNTTADRLGTLMAAFAHQADGSGVFESGQNPIIVGQAAYNSAYGTDFVESGWCNSPTNPSARCDGYARIQEQGWDLFGFNTLAAPTEKLQIPLQPKGIHDEMNSANFDEFGRMTANIGLEAPGATPLLQNIILYPYVNPATEVLDSTGMPSSLDVTPIATADDGTQVWKITHNGVDTHPLHFHLYDIQLINRVAWDNNIKPPEPTELGWKDTLRVSPLEDTYVVLRPIVPTIPFGVLESKRPLNPMMPIGARGSEPGGNALEAGFNNTDAEGAPIAPIINIITNFGWEYVWHCHILSHEEMDMMRPVTVYVPTTVPDAPVLSFTQGSVILNWTDGTVVDYLDPTTWASLKNEVGYRIERAIGAGNFVEIATAPANVTTYTDLTADPNEAYRYRVVAYNASGDSLSNEVTVQQQTSTTVVTSGLNPSNNGDSVIFTATVSPAGATGTVEFFDGATSLGTSPLSGDTATLSIATLAVGDHTITAAYSGDTAYQASTSAPITQTVNPSLPAVPAGLTVTPGAPGSLIVSWTYTSNGAPGPITFHVMRSNNGVDGWTSVTSNFTATTLTNTGLPTGVTRYYRVRARNADGYSAWSNTASATTSSAVILPAVPAGLTVTPGAPGSLIVSWSYTSNGAPGPITFHVMRSNNGVDGWTSVTSNFTATTLTNTGLPTGVTRYYRVRARNADGYSAWSNTASATTSSAVILPAVPAGLTVTPGAPGSLIVSWSYTSNGAPGPITFHVMRSNNGVDGWTSVTSNFTATTLTNTGLPTGVTRYYRVRARNADGYSAWSVIASATVP